MRRVLLAVLALGSTSGCMAFSNDEDGVRLVCRSDAECDTDEVCFADGCGNPGQNIVVEVRANPQEGLHEQDFPVENLRPRHNIELFGPAALQGQVLRPTAPGAADLAYTAPISVRVTGESLLIPGQTRLYQGTFVPENGSWQLYVGTGSATVTLQAADPDVPPLTQTRVVGPGSAVPVDFRLPAATSVTRLSGKLVRLGTALVDAELEVQALDETLTPLSQRVPVARLTGDFALTLPPSAAQRSHVLLQVTQVTKLGRSEALVPQKTFTVDPRKPLPAPLELGDYGEPVTVRGRVLDVQGQPVAGASVYVTGKVGGGGSFRSASATTGADGVYTLRTLPSQPDTPLALYAVPPADALAGSIRQVTVVRRDDTALADVRCPNKVELRGQLLRPEAGSPAAGVEVVANPLREVNGWPLPGERVAGTTDASGNFALRLDPGEYRIDFNAAENLPRVSRFVTVRPAESAELAPFPLSKGRGVTGQVTLRSANGALSSAAYANVRFFRVVNVEGKPTAVLLAESTADGAGHYMATLPTR
jgi:hypothetical protein